MKAWMRSGGYVAHPRTIPAGMPKALSAFQRARLWREADVMGAVDTSPARPRRPTSAPFGNSSYTVDDPRSR